MTWRSAMCTSLLKCLNCDKSNDSSYIFCFHCGKSLENVSHCNDAANIVDFRASDAIARQEAATRIVGSICPDSESTINGDRIVYPSNYPSVEIALTLDFQTDHIFFFDNNTGEPAFHPQCNSFILNQIRIKQAAGSFPTEIAVAVKNSHIAKHKSEHTLYWCKYCK